ncbi:MAG: response regulator [Chloroflexi bacterium]|nr:response regulator [Chloroflexota bacterium]
MAKKIAVIDDSREFVQFCQDLLESEGYEVLPSVGSLRAYEIVKHGKPDLVMVDIMMPGRSGWELIDILRMDPETKDIPIIISTAVRAATARLAGTKYDVLKKPFEVHELLAKVKKLIGNP